MKTMMTKNASTPRRPTDAELEILRVLWDLGEATVREVQETIEKEKRRAAGYTTVLKLLQIMTEKGLVERNESERAHVYRARLEREETEKQLVGDLLERAFGGSASRLVLQALASKTASAEEIAEIREFLDRVPGEDS
ncbi:MAG: BlaI/MecI/CopY family transcriptional regulator [Acidobacteriota bacterium]